MAALYEERLNADLNRIRKRLRLMGEGVLQALRNATRALLTRDVELATETILGDLPINRRYRDIDHLCHVFVARHLPSAGHLRTVSAALRLGKTLERIGDYAETISRAALQLVEPASDQIKQDVEMMAGHADKILGEALRSFDERDLELARTTLEIASRHGSTFDKVFNDLVAEGERGERPMADLFSLMAVFNRLERVIHQAKNICEQTVLVVTGATKHEKTFDILFVDNRNAGASLLAEHWARKAYPEGGTYASAGWEVATDVDPAYQRFAEEKGCFLGDVKPRSFDTYAEELTKFEIIIDLSGSAKKHLPKVPFHTTLLSWPIENRDDPEAFFKELSARLGHLMERLRGDEDD